MLTVKTFIQPFLVILLFLAVKIKAQPVLTLSPVITTGLSLPIQLVHAGDGSKRIFIVQKAGSILVYNKAFGLIGTFLTVPNITTMGERGLLSLAFHPNYASNGLFYIYYTNSNGDLQVARYSVSADPNVADPLSKDTMITIPHPNNTNHNGGELHFGKDGYLYLSTGDGGGQGDITNNAQNLNSLLGKILRFEVNTSVTPPFYSIPPTNPFGNEIFAYGLRNPFRWSFDKVTNDMWIGDVGEDTWEEINYRPVDSSLGVNYGWRCYQADAVYNNTVGCLGPLSNYVFPISAYLTPAPSGSVTGGTVYRGNTYIDLRGYYLATDFFTGIFYKVKYDTVTHTATTATQALPIAYIADFGETEDGELYAVEYFGNAVHRIVSNGSIGYTFIGNGNWDVATNWRNNAIPPAILPLGAEIIIEPELNGECILNVPQTILTGAKIIVQKDMKFRINGNLNIQ